MRDLRGQVPGGRRGGPKHSGGTAARGGLKQSFGAAAEAVANPLLYQTREGLGGWREHRERRVCTDTERSGVVGTHVGAMRSSFGWMWCQVSNTLARAVVKTIDQEYMVGQESDTLAGAVVKADDQE